MRAPLPRPTPPAAAGSPAPRRRPWTSAFAAALFAGAFAVTLLATAAPAVAGAAPPRMTAPEKDLKAAYLLSFIRFVRRADAPASPAAEPIAIAVLGDPDLGKALQAAVQDKHIDGRGIVVTMLREPDSLRSYDMVFVGLALSSRVDQALARAHNAPVLTVGETDDFVERGGMIGLFFEDRKLRFAINVEAAERANLRISSNLLSLAAEVRGRRR